MNPSSIHAFWLSFKWQFLLQHHKLLNRWLILTTALFVILSVGMSIGEVKITVSESGLTPTDVIRAGMFVVAMGAYYVLTPYLVSSVFDVAGRPETRLYELMRPVSPLIKHASLWLLGVLLATVGVLSALVVADVLRYLLFLLLGLHRQGFFIGLLWDGVQRSLDVLSLLFREGLVGAGLPQIQADGVSLTENASSMLRTSIVLKVLDVVVEWAFWTLCLVWAKFTFKRVALLLGSLIYFAYALVIHYLEQGMGGMQWSEPLQWGVQLIIALLCTAYLMRQCYLLHHHQPIK